MAGLPFKLPGERNRLSIPGESDLEGLGDNITATLAKKL